MHSTDLGITTFALVDLPATALAPLAFLVVTPVMLWGADLLFDELLEVRDELRDRLVYRSFLYLSVILVGAFIVAQAQGSSSYLESLRITAGSLLWILIGLLLSYTTVKLAMKRSWEAKRRKRIERIELELPQYLEMFYILITSGMSVLSALKVLAAGKGSGAQQEAVGVGAPSTSFWRVAIKGSSQRSESLRDVIAQVLHQVEAGSSIEKSLDKSVMATGSEQLRRFSDAVILGMERGSSMGQSLRNLISETRNQAKVLVMQRAGKAEIQLLIPVVFLILPISVMFAIWPSYVNLVSIMG